MDKTQDKTSSYGLGHFIVFLIGFCLVFTREDSITLLGCSLILLSISWPWKIGRFPIGRVLVLSLIVITTTLLYTKEPEPPETANPRGPSNSLGAVKFNIYGVTPGMTYDQVESLLGEPTPDVDSHVYVFNKGSVRVTFDSALKVRSVEGDLLHDGEKVFLRRGDSAQKLRAIFGQHVQGRGGRLYYSFVDPDLEVDMTGELIKNLVLTK